MSVSRRSILAAAGTGLAWSQASGVTKASAHTLASPDGNQSTDELIRRSGNGHAALMRGDVDEYRAHITLADDFTLFSPFGGKPNGSGMTRDQVDAMGRFFKNGTMRQDVVHAVVSTDVVVLALIEWNDVEVGGLAAQEWPLRVTLVYRREGSEWRLAHRHADPLVRSVTLPEAAALALGALRPGTGCE